MYYIFIEVDVRSQVITNINHYNIIILYFILTSDSPACQLQCVNITKIIYTNIKIVSVSSHIFIHSNILVKHSEIAYYVKRTY